MLIGNGFRYFFQKELSNNLQSREFVVRRKGQCKAKVNLHMNGELVGEINEHTHPPSQDQIEITKIKASIKRESQATHDTPQQILGAALQNISETAAINLPQINNLKRTIHSQRKDNDLPPAPLRREDIPVLPGRYQVTQAGEQFMIFDRGVGDNERILIFVTQQGIHFLSNNSHWFMDGTFKLCPEIFYQIYTIHALNNNQVFPCVFALLPNKNEVTYNVLFREVRNAVIRQGNEPTDILIDFERAAVNAVTNQMPKLQALKVNFNLTYSSYVFISTCIFNRFLFSL